MLAPRLDSSRLQVPLLVIGAGADPLFDPREQRATARAHGVEAEIVPDAAHDLMLDPGWEGVASRIVEWARALPGTAPAAAEVGAAPAR